MKAGQRIQIKHDSSRLGTLTGKTRKRGKRLLYQVQWDEGSADYIPEDQLKLTKKPPKKNKTGANKPDSRFDIDEVPIIPGVSILGILPALPYTPWKALGEFVDNSLASWIDNKNDLKKTRGKHYRLKVTIELQGAPLETITIRDNAAGINSKEYLRAFKPAELPEKTTGLNEFGLGMKSAAFWLAKKWKVVTSALGEPVVRTLAFDIDEILEKKSESLKPESEKEQLDRCYTVLTLSNLNQKLLGPSRKNVKAHLAEMFSQFTRSGELELIFSDNGREEKLIYEEPEFLTAPQIGKDNQPINQKKFAWKKRVNFAFGDKRIHGFVAILKTMSTSLAGLSLFRRNRIILGSHDEKYQPMRISGSKGSHRYKRIYGELHLEGFNVFTNKDGFKWEDDEEEEILELLHDCINDDNPPPGLLRQADRYRTTPFSGAKGKSDIKGVVSATGDVLVRNPPGLIDDPSPPASQKPPKELPPTKDILKSTFTIPGEKQDWKITVRISNEPSIPWIEISDSNVSSAKSKSGKPIYQIGVRLSLNNNFMRKYGGDKKKLEPFVRIAVGLAIAQKVAIKGGFKEAPVVLAHLNKLIEEDLGA